MKMKMSSHRLVESKSMKKVGALARPHPGPLPRGEGEAVARLSAFGNLLVDRRCSVVRSEKESNVEDAAKRLTPLNDSPSPASRQNEAAAEGGEGRGEGGRLHQLLVCLVITLFTSVASAATTGSLVAGNTTFAFDLYAQLKGKQGNVFFSPYSISTCLAMTYAGARGDTEKQMAEVLHFSQKQDQIHSYFGEMQRQLNPAGGRKGVELSIANALWAQKGHPFLPAFLKVATSQYDAKLNQADFKTGADAAVREINLWVEKKTRDKIQNILVPGSLNEDTRLVLADAIYFKGAWAKAFVKRATVPQPFHISKSRKTDVPLMYRTDKIKYMEDDSVQAVELPYKGNELSMVVLLPKEVEGYNRLDESLNFRNLQTWLGKMKLSEVVLMLPKFKVGSTFELSRELEKMGMRDAFQLNANFSGIDGRTNLSISGISHKAWAEVTEEGTEAAAATVVTISETSAKPMPIMFRADHPFIFLIRDVRSGSILFLGRLVDPAN